MKIVKIWIEEFPRAFKVCVETDEGKTGVITREGKGFRCFDHTLSDNREFLGRITVCNPQFDIVKSYWLSKNAYTKNRRDLVSRGLKAGLKLNPGLKHAILTL